MFTPRPNQNQNCESSRTTNSLKWLSARPIDSRIMKIPQTLLFDRRTISNDYEQSDGTLKISLYLPPDPIILGPTVMLGTTMTTVPRALLAVRRNMEASVQAQEGPVAPKLSARKLSLQHGIVSSPAQPRLPPCHLLQPPLRLHDPIHRQDLASAGCFPLRLAPNLPVNQRPPRSILLSGYS